MNETLTRLWACENSGLLKSWSSIIFEMFGHWNFKIRARYIAVSNKVKYDSTIALDFVRGALKFWNIQSTLIPTHRKPSFRSVINEKISASNVLLSFEIRRRRCTSDLNNKKDDTTTRSLPFFRRSIFFWNLFLVCWSGCRFVFCAE